MAGSSDKSEASNKSEASLGARLVIVLLALGVVLIGLKPLRSDLRRISHSAKNYVRASLPEVNELRKFAPEVFSRPGTDVHSGTDEVSEEDSEEDRRLLLATPGVEKKVLLEKKLPSGIVLDKRPQKKQLDHLDSDDRKQLADLVNGF